MVETEQVVTRILKETFEAFHARMKDDNYNELAKQLISNEKSMSQVLDVIGRSLQEDETKKKEVEPKDMKESSIKESIDLGDEGECDEEERIEPVAKDVSPKPVEVIDHGEEAAKEKVIELCADDDDDDVVLKEGSVSVESAPASIEEPEESAPLPKTKREKTRRPVTTEAPITIETPVATLVQESPSAEALEIVQEQPTASPAGPSSITATSLKGKYNDEMAGYALEFLDYTKQYATDQQYQQFLETYSEVLDKKLIDENYNGDKRAFFCAAAFGSLKHVLKVPNPTKNAYASGKSVEPTSLCRSIKMLRANGLQWVK